MSDSVKEEIEKLKSLCGHGCAYGGVDFTECVHCKARVEALEQIQETKFYGKPFIEQFKHLSPVKMMARYSAVCEKWHEVEDLLEAKKSELAKKDQRIGQLEAEVEGKDGATDAGLIKVGLDPTGITHTLKIRHLVEALQAAREEVKELRETQETFLTLREYNQNMEGITAEFDVDKGAGVYMAACFAKLVDDAPNYAESIFRSNRDGKNIVVTVQKVEVKTPHQMRQEAESENAQLQKENEDLSNLIFRQSSILSRVAAALKGPAPRLTKWSHHDLPQVALKIKLQRDLGERGITQIREALESINKAINGEAHDYRRIKLNAGEEIDLNDPKDAERLLGGIKNRLDECSGVLGVDSNKYLCETPIDANTPEICLQSNGKPINPADLPHDTGDPERPCRCVAVEVDTKGYQGGIVKYPQMIIKEAGEIRLSPGQMRSIKREEDAVEKPE